MNAKMTTEEEIRMKIKANEIAIRSLEAWQKVLDTLHKWTNESRGVAHRDAYFECIELIVNSFNEVTGRKWKTNGEVIMSSFPHYDIEVYEEKGCVRVFYEDFYTTYPLKWWNAMYNVRVGEARKDDM